MYSIYVKGCKKIILSCAMALIAVVSSGCATLPNVSEIVEDVPVGAQPPEIVSARGPLTPAASKAIIRKIKRYSGVSDILERQTLALEAASGRPLISGNKATLLVDGPATYAAMLEAIRNARHNINLETFIFEDDEVGRLFADEFLKKQAEGVQVNIIYDSIGSSAGQAFFQRLKDNGINVVSFNPVTPLWIVAPWYLTHRDHRKILVVDGTIAFTGGVNISRVYSSSPSGIVFFKREREEKEEKELGIPWRDTHVRIEGPAVAEFQRLFMETWKEEGGTQLPVTEYFPRQEPRGQDLVQVVGSTPGELNRVTFIMYVAAFLNSQRSIHLTTAYFVPDGQTVTSLLDAAQRGVDVKLILPTVSDSKLILYAGRYYYSDFLAAGVKLYERQHAFLHAKTAVVDGVWSTVGSTNMDTWSFLHNNEVNAIIISRPFAIQMEALFAKDLGESRQLTLAEWKKRPLLSRLLEWIAHVFRRYL
jgi:cardiolipin synthase A/B